MFVLSVPRVLSKTELTLVRQCAALHHSNAQAPAAKCFPDLFLCHSCQLTGNHGTALHAVVCHELGAISDEGGAKFDSQHFFLFFGHAFAPPSLGGWAEAAINKSKGRSSTPVALQHSLSNRPVPIQAVTRNMQSRVPCWAATRSRRPQHSRWMCSLWLGICGTCAQVSWPKAQVCTLHMHVLRRDFTRRMHTTAFFSRAIQASYL